MARKSEEIIEKPVASRGRPRKDASNSSTSATKKASKTKKKATKKASSSKKVVNKTSKTRTNQSTTSAVIENIEYAETTVVDPIIENSVPSEVILEENIVENIIENLEIIEDKNLEDVVETPNTLIEDSVSIVSEEIKSDETIIEVPESASKRKIRDISVKKPNVTNKTNIEIEKDSEPEIQETKVIENAASYESLPSDEKNVLEIPKKSKRTLKLNLKPHKEENQDSIATPSYKKDESINQNSSFFNEPSIFAKFNIDITSTESDEIVEDTENAVIIEENSSEVTNNITQDENEFDDSIIINSVLSILENNSELGESEISDYEISEEPIEAESIEDILDETIEQISAEEIINEIEDENDIELEDSIFEDCIDELVLDELETEVILDNDLGEDILEIAQEEDFKLQEAADSIINEPIAEKISDDSPVGKFFDSSTPSMSSSTNNTFSKIKKSIFSNISPIFKKFTFEEASLITDAEDLENNFVEQGNNLSDIQKALENFSPNAQNISSNITEMDVQAEPVLTTPVIENDTAIFPMSSDNNYDTTEQLNIITPASESSYENLETLKEEYNDEEFSIESYFGLDNKSDEKEEIVSSDESAINEVENEASANSEDFAEKFLESNENTENIVEDIKVEEELEAEAQITDKNIQTAEVINEAQPENEVISQEESNELEKTLEEKELEISNLSKLLESFTETISTLTNRIADLENKQSQNISEPIESSENAEIIDGEDIENDEINIDDINIEDLDINDIDLDDVELLENTDLESEESSLLSQEEISDEENKSVESILSEVFLSKDFDLDNDLKNELLSELSYAVSSSENESNLDNALLEEALLDDLSDEELENLDNTSEQEALGPESDFSKIIDSLTKAITELEQAPDIKNEIEKRNEITSLAPFPDELMNYTVTEEKAINILINKDDIFSISILNETYEIVADFDGISVLSENIHISTPKNNFFVRVGNKYIEIHNKKDHFELNTNFEDIEFANAINNIAFAKKNNKIELNIKEAFKLSSVNNKIELSMLNKAIADLSSAQSTSNENQDDSSICDNKTLLISEETQKVYLPYTIEDVMKKLKSSEEYQTVQEVVDKEYTLPLSTFKMPIISRFKEAYRFMRTKENSSVYAAVDLALELMFNSNLNPAVIRAAKDLKELNIYLDCLYENEVEKFDCFKIIYKVLPKIK